MPSAAAQPYKDRQVVDVLRGFQRQGVKIIFSSALVTPELRVIEEPHGDDPQEIITAILAPHDLTVRVGLRGVLLVVRATSANARPGAIVGTVRDRAARRPVAAATVRVDGTPLSVHTQDDGGFRLAMVPAGIRTLIVQAPDYALLRSDIRVSPSRTTTVLLEIVRAHTTDRVGPSEAPLAVSLREDIAPERRGERGTLSNARSRSSQPQSRIQ
jgi:hypothetical protein